MKNLPTAVRLIAAIAAAGVTFALLFAALSIAAPERDILIAKMEHAEKRTAATANALANATVVVAMASTGADSLRK